MNKKTTRKLFAANREFGRVWTRFDSVDADLGFLRADVSGVKRDMVDVKDCLSIVEGR